MHYSPYSRHRDTERSQSLRKSNLPLKRHLLHFAGSTHCATSLGSRALISSHTTTPFRLVGHDPTDNTYLLVSWVPGILWKMSNDTVASIAGGTATIELRSQDLLTKAFCPLLEGRNLTVSRSWRDLSNYITQRAGFTFSEIPGRAENYAMRCIAYFSVEYQYPVSWLRSPPFVSLYIG